jgi:hypothetical protein
MYGFLQGLTAGPKKAVWQDLALTLKTLMDTLDSFREKE